MNKLRYKEEGLTRMRPFAYGVVLLALWLSGCAHTASHTTLAAQAEVFQSTERYRKEYVLAPGDQVDVVVYRNPELSRQAVVLYDGFISLPVLDRIEAAGLTVTELDDLLTRRYSERLVDPEVTVIIQRAHEPMVYVAGEVGTVRAVPLREAHTAAQALAQCGGANRSGAKRRIAIVRLDDEGRLCAYVLERSSRGPASFYLALQNTPLQADDVVVVPESHRSQFVRFIEDFLNTPLGGINQALSPYFQFTILKEIQESAERQEEIMRTQ